MPNSVGKGYHVYFSDGRLYGSASSKVQAQKMAGKLRRDGYKVKILPASKQNPSMKRPKLNQWVKAARVRLVKRNGATHVEIQRTVAKKKKAATKKRR